MIPVCTPVITEADEASVMRALRAGWVSSEGPYVEQFERNFADYIGMADGIAVCNGTAAVETALYAAGVGEGDEVILPTFTIISCIIAVLRLGARPVLVDIHPDTWCLDVDQAVARITPKTKAIIAVHIYGHPADMAPLLEAAARHGVVVIEDAAQAHGAEYHGVRCGSLAPISAFSFYANKLITTGEGGMVLCRDPAAAKRARSYRNLCFDSQKRFLHEDIGYNFRMTSMQAALGISQLARADQIVARKRAMGAIYVERLSAVPGLVLQIEKPWARSIFWMYAFQMPPDLGWSAQELMDELREKEIGSRPFFLGLHAQPALQRYHLSHGVNGFPLADAAYRYGLYLPSGLSLSDQDVHFVCDTIIDLLRSRCR